MDLAVLDKDEYQNILLLKMADNRHGDLLFFVRTYTLTGKDTGYHRHEYLQINYVAQGKACHEINHQRFEISRGDIFVIPPYIPHQITAADKTSVTLFEFEFEPAFINQDFRDFRHADSFLDFAYIEPFLVSENLVRPKLNLAGKLQIDVEAILREVLQEYQEKNAGYILLIRAMLLKLLVLVGRAFSSELQTSENQTIFSRHREAIEGAMRYIDDHSAEELSIEDVARRFMLSQSYFSYLFKSVTARTFTNYVNDLRIAKAQTLLRTTGRKILDICCSVGFNNVNHFNRIFRQQTGVSPGAYRKGESTQNKI